MNVSTKRNQHYKKYVAEIVGTFTLVFLGCGSAVIGNRNGDLGVFGISCAFGLSIVAMAYTFGNISGCHLNPAVTLAMFVIKSVNKKQLFWYTVSQLVGSVLASLSIYGIASGKDDYSLKVNGLGQNGYGDHSPGNYTVWTCFVMEMMFTFVFVLVILGSTSEKSGHVERIVSGFVIGLTLTMIHLIGIPITGLSVNPARSFGPALVMLAADPIHFEQLWLFFIAPCFGSILATLVWKFFFDEQWQKKHGLLDEPQLVASQRAQKSPLIIAEEESIITPPPQNNTNTNQKQ